MGQAATRPVVVGVDGSPASLRALDLAVHEAILRDAPLRILSVRIPVGAWLASVALRPPRLDPDRILAVGVTLATRDGLTVDPAVVDGLPTTVLIEASADASLTVVGHRGIGGYPGLPAGSVSKQVAARGGGPVIVTRGPADESNVDSPILLGVDVTSADQCAIEFAFAEAALRGVELKVLHAAPATDGPPAVPLTALTAQWRARFPDVEVDAIVVHGMEASAALLAESARVGLVVIGQCARRQARRLGLGSVGETLVHQGACPVAIAHGVG